MQRGIERSDSFQLHPTRQPRGGGAAAVWPSVTIPYYTTTVCLLPSCLPNTGLGLFCPRYVHIEWYNSPRLSRRLSSNSIQHNPTQPTLSNPLGKRREEETKQGKRRKGKKKNPRTELDLDPSQSDPISGIPCIPYLWKPLEIRTHNTTLESTSWSGPTETHPLTCLFLAATVNCCGSISSITRPKCQHHRFCSS